MLRPRGVAVIGASEGPNSLGTRYLGGILRHGFEGAIHAVNPKYDEVMGLACYDSILDVPDPVDTAVLSVREDLVERTLTECAERGLAGAVIFAGGYREIGPEGAERERRLTELARELGIRFIGPNSPGFMNFVDRAVITATSVAFRESFPPGGRLGAIRTMHSPLPPHPSNTPPDTRCEKPRWSMIHSWYCSLPGLFFGRPAKRM